MSTKKAKALAAQDTIDKEAELDLLKKKAEDRSKVLKSEMQALVDNRQDVINPYEGMTNEMANLGVATQAAEFQAEQTDIALANTLDAMRSSGAGAGGATALAQAALQSKKGIAANLERQEASNQKAAAQGAQDLQNKLAEGKKFAFGVTENRENADVNRAAKELENQKQQAADAETMRVQAEIGDALNT
tara:strand:+ start:2648 stop:3217 length:570 start_codon:yes stop_codon:yes gene_type:complete